MLLRRRISAHDAPCALLLLCVGGVFPASQRPGRRRGGWQRVFEARKEQRRWQHRVEQILALPPPPIVAASPPFEDPPSRLQRSRGGRTAGLLLLLLLQRVGEAREGRPVDDARQQSRGSACHCSKPLCQPPPTAAACD